MYLVPRIGISISSTELGVTLYSSERRPESGLPPSLAGQSRVRLARETRLLPCYR